MAIGDSTILQASGAISFSDINTEMDNAATAEMSLGADYVRQLLIKETGAVGLGDAHAKKWALLVTSASDCYAYSGAFPHRPVEHIDKGELALEGTLLKASDGKYVGKHIDVFFTTSNYAENATQFTGGNYAKADNPRVSDGATWTLDAHDRSTTTNGYYNCFSGCGGACWGGGTYYKKHTNYRRDKWV